MDVDGKRWFFTGDVGQFDEDGSVRIIGRFYSSFAEISMKRNR